MIRLTRLFEQNFRLPSADEDENALVAADARRAWLERRTLLIVASDDEGRVGLGEAAPLPDYSPDSLDDAWNALAPLVGTELGQLGEPGSSRELRGVADRVASPSARFALESALLELWARRRGEPAWALLGRLERELAGAPAETPSTTDGRAVAALLPPGAARALEHAARAFQRGVRSFKAKIGAPGAWTEELATLRAVKQKFPEARLRADANQSLSPAELRARLPALRELELEWLEEPSARFPDGLETPLGVPLALDESLQTAPPEPTAAHERGVRAYVLKPTALGGFVRAFELARAARAAGLAVVASHVYEGPVGFSAVAAFSLALGPDRPADGLARHAGIADAPELPAFDAEKSRIVAWSEPGFGLSLAELARRRPVTREVNA